jgi:hypothetical protein
MKTDHTFVSHTDHARGIRRDTNPDMSTLGEGFAFRAWVGGRGCSPLNEHNGYCLNVCRYGTIPEERMRINNVELLLEWCLRPASLPQPGAILP